MSSVRVAQESPNARTDDRCCIGCGHVLQGVTSLICSECGRGFDPDDPRTTARVGNWGLRRGLIGTCRVLHWAFLLFAAALILYSGLGGHWLLVAMIVVCSFPLVLLQFGLLALPNQPISMRRRMLGYVVLLVVVSIPFTDWPVRATFMMHRGALQAIADRVHAGEALPRETRVGILRYRQIRQSRNQGHVGFQLNGGAGGGMYFVATPPGFAGEPSSHGPLRNFRNVWDNTNWTVDLGDGWYLVEQD
ncbi:hypothetical protein OAG01_00960 [bacterium]|nr:hypothetical protein [bacterium]